MSLPVRFETLEGRVLFSADLPGALASPEAVLAAELSSEPTAPASPIVIDLSDRRHVGSPGLDAPGASQAPSDDVRRELIIIDGRVAAAAVLYGMLTQGADAGRHFELVVLDPHADGVDRIGDELLARAGAFDAVHLIGHGSPRGMLLGSSQLDAESLLTYAERLGLWQASLSDDADILLYGCDLAADELGEAWLERLAVLTGADVAASIDATGSAELGGDWELEFRSGVIEGILAPPPDASDRWAHVLGPNEATAGTQSNASLASADNGDTVVVWQSENQDGSGWGVYGRRYDAAGSPLGGEFLVAQTSAGDQYEPDVAIAAGGDFVVVWTGRGQDGDGAGEGNVYARRFAADGTPYGGEFRVNTTTAGDQHDAAVGITAGGTVAVVWTSAGQDGSGDGVVARTYDLAGNALTAEFIVNTTTVGHQRAPDVVGDNYDDFIFVWQSEAQDGSGWGIYRTYLALNGNFEGGEKRVNTETAGDQTDPVAAFNPNGSWLIAWTSVGQDGSGAGIYGQYFRYTGNGGSATGEFRISETTQGDQFDASIAADAAGNFIVVWTSLGQDADQPAEANVYARLIERAGGSVALSGGESRVNAEQTGSQQNATVVMTGAGGYAVVWEGAGTGDAAGVYLQPFANPLGNESPVVSMSASALTYVENSGPAVIDAALSLDDDGNTLAGATVAIVQGFSAAQDVLAVVNQHGISGSYDAAAGVLTLTGTATLSNYRAVLRSVTYANISDAPSTTTRRIAVTVNDGSRSAGGYRDIALQAVNDAPALAGANALLPVFEDAASNSGTLVSALLDGWLSDPDSGAASGIAVVAVDDTHGTWQYSTSGGAAWSAFGAVSAAGARLLAADAATYVRFVPQADWHGTVAGGLIFRAWDRTGGSVGGLADTTSNGGTTAFSTSTAAAGIVVNSVNDAPSGSDAVLTLNEDANRVLSAADFGFADALDVPANALDAVRIATLPSAGTLWNNAIAVSSGQFIARADIDAGRLVYTPAANASGIAYASFSFQLRDSGGTANGGIDLDATPDTLTFDVVAANDAPVNALPVTQYTAFNAPLALASGTLNAISVDDPDAGSNPVEVTIVAGNGVVTLAGTTGLTFTLGDGSSDVGMVFRGTLADIGAALDGLIFTPLLNFSGAATLTLGASDLGASGAGGVRTDDDTLTIMVAAADALVVVADGYAASEDAALSGASVLVNDSDPLFGIMSVAAVNGNAAAIGAPIVLASGALLTMYADGTFDYDPNGAYAYLAPGTVATDSFSYSVASTSGRTGQGNVTVTVSGMNDAPVLTGANDLVAVLEDAAGAAGTLVSALVAGRVSDADAGAATGIAVTGVDDANGTWQYTTDAGATWSAFGAPTVLDARLLLANADTAVRFVPQANWNGTVAGGLQFRAWDGSNGAAGSTADTTLSGGVHAYSLAAAAAGVVVGAVNDAPAGTDGSIGMDEDASRTLTAADFGFVDAADTPGNTLAAVQILTLPAAGTLRNNGVTVSAGQFVARADIDAGRLVFTPAVNGNGAGYASLGFRVQDSGGTANGGVDLDAVANLIVFDVRALNDAPELTTFVGLPFSGSEDTPVALTFALLLAQSDAADVDGAVTAFVVKSVPGGMLRIGTSATAATPYAAGSNDVIDATRSAYWTPPGDAWGMIEAFSVAARDDLSAESTQTATVRVTVSPIADRPDVTSAATLEDVRTPPCLVITRNVVDGAEVTHFEVSAIAGGTLYLADGVTQVVDGSFITVAQGEAGLVFEPAADSTADGSFVVRAATAAQPAAVGGEAAAVTVTVAAVNDAPVLAALANLPDLVTGEAGSALSVIDLLAGYVSDVDAGAQAGVAIVGADAAHGVWQYTLDGGSTWNALGTVSEAAALLLAAEPGVAIRFRPDAGYLGAASIDARAWDRTSGTAGTYADAAGNGGVSAFSAQVRRARVQVVSAPMPNDALPVSESTRPPAADASGSVPLAAGAGDAGGARTNDEVRAALVTPKDAPASSGRAATTASAAEALAPAAEGVVANGEARSAAPAGGDGMQAPAAPASPPPMLVQPTPVQNLPAGTPAVVPPSAVALLGQDFVPQPEQAAAVVAGKEMRAALDAVREAVQAEGTIEAQVAAASVAITGSLSAGYVMWLVRGGVLATSLMSSLPAWRVLDPLPVLSNRRRRSDEDDESLQSMVDGDAAGDDDDADATVAADGAHPTKAGRRPEAIS